MISMCFNNKICKMYNNIINLQSSLKLMIKIQIVIYPILSHNNINIKIIFNKNKIYLNKMKKLLLVMMKIQRLHLKIKNKSRI